MRSTLVVGSALVIAAGVAALLLSFGEIRLFPLFFMFTLGFGLVLGLPLYLIVRWQARASWAAALTGGFFVGAVLPALLVLASPAPDQASVGGVATAVNGAYTAYGWGQNLLFVGLFGAVGAAGGLAFWALVRRRGAGASGETGGESQAARPLSNNKVAALAAGAIAVTAAAFIVPQATMDRSCHNTMRDGRASIAPEASFALRAEPREWRSIAAEIEAFGRAGGWSILSEVRPDDSFQWFQISLCKEPGTNIFADAIPEMGRVIFGVFQPQGGTSWRAPFAELFARIHRRWPDRVQFIGPRGEPIGPPEWVPHDAQTPSHSSPPGNSSAL